MEIFISSLLASIIFTISNSLAQSDLALAGKLISCNCAAVMPVLASFIKISALSPAIFFISSVFFLFITSRSGVLISSLYLLSSSIISIRRGMVKSTQIPSSLSFLSAVIATKITSASAVALSIPTNSMPLWVSCLSA